MSLETKLKERFGDALDPPDDVEDLDLEGLVQLKVLSKADQQFLERFTSVLLLSLKNVGLDSLDNLPNLPTLQLVSNFVRLVVRFE